LFDGSARVLELGADCGIITGLLCEKNSFVVAVEADEECAEVNSYLNRNHHNLTVINKAYDRYFEDISPEEKYDYVTMIGCFDETLLPKVKSCLKPGGRLIVAVDNRYGIKNWSGSPDEVTGKPFAALEGIAGDLKAISYSRNELVNILQSAGFDNNEFYYPVPDYRLTEEIYSEEYLPAKGVLKANTPSYCRDRLLAFDEVLVADSLSRDGMYNLFANSFLVINY
jgi:SAM-dependent methyltransferase